MSHFSDYVNTALDNVIETGRTVKRYSIDPVRAGLRNGCAFTLDSLERFLDWSWENLGRVSGMILAVGVALVVLQIRNDWSVEHGGMLVAIIGSVSTVVGLVLAAFAFHRCRVAWNRRKG